MQPILSRHCAIFRDSVLSFDRITGCNIPTDSSTENRVKSKRIDISVTSRFCDLTRFRVDTGRESWYPVDSTRIACSRFVLAAVRHGFCGAASTPHEGNEHPHEGNVRQTPRWKSSPPRGKCSRSAATREMFARIFCSTSETRT